MTLKHITFHQSPVMRELERLAVKRGHFDATPEEAIDTAAQQIGDPDLEPSSSKDEFFNDVMRLASALRAQGFEKQADDIERNAVAFKIAERHLYRVHDEDGDDFLDYAHPEGEFDVAPAEQGNGKVETTLTQHKRIMDVVNSTPTGKLAAIASEIIRTAQKTAPEETRDENQKKIDRIYGVLKSELRNIRNWVAKNFPNQAGVGDELDKLSSGLGVTLGLDESKYNAAMDQIKNSVAKVQIELGKLKQPNDVTGAIAYQEKSMLVNHYDLLTQQANGEIGKLIPGLKGREIAALDRPLNKKKLQTAIGYYNWSLKAWAYALERYQESGDTDGATKSAKNIETIRRVISIISAAINADNTMSALQQALQKDAPVMGEDDLVQNAFETQKSTQAVLAGILPKQSSSKPQLIKTEQLALETPKSAPPPPPPPPPPAPGAPPAKTPGAPAKSTPGAGMAKRPAAPGRPTADERQNVSIMQRLMSELATGLEKQSDQVSQLLAKKDPSMTPENVKNFSRIIADTAKGTGSPFDGVWGPRTRKGLEAVNGFTYRAGVPSVDVGEGDNPYRTMTPEETSNKAKKNSQLISQLMGKLGLGEFRKTEVPGAPAGEVQGPLDVVPQTLTNAGILDRSGKVPVYEANLGSLQDFFAYLTGQGFSVSMPSPKSAAEISKLEKLAFEITGQAADWVWRTAPAWNKPTQLPAWQPPPGYRPPTGGKQQAATQPGQSFTYQAPAFGQPPVAVNQPKPAEQKEVYTMSVAQFDGALRWFYQRAYQQARLASTPQDGKPIDQQASQRAIVYKNALEQLIRKWSVIKQTQSLAPNSSVNFFNLQDWEGSARPGAGMRRPGESGSGEQYGEGVDVGGGGVGGAGRRRSKAEEAIDEPPFTYANRGPRRYIDLEYLAQRYHGGSMKRFFAKTLLTKEALDGTPQSFAATFASDAARRAFATNPPTLSYRIWVAKSADYIMYQLRIIFENWRKEVATVARPTKSQEIEELIAANNDELQDWSNRLLSLADYANGDQ